MTSIVTQWRLATGRSKDDAAGYLIVSHRMIDHLESGARDLSKKNRELIRRDLAERRIQLDGF